MRISSSHNFIFVHVPKTAGSAISNALAPFTTNPKRTILRSFLRRTPLVESHEKAHFRIHERAVHIRAKLSSTVYDRFYSFAVIRNPYDHAVSHYEFMKQYRIKSTAIRVGNMSFSEYLDYRMKRPLWNDTLFARQPAQSWFVADDDNRLLVNRLLYYESLQQDFDQLITDLSLTGAVLHKLNPTKTKTGTTSFSTYAGYYDGDSETKVRQIYARDFRNFGYSTDICQREAEWKVSPTPFRTDQQ
ncbi:MAG: sulfotransferase family 2 domain-containing protein [Paracoccaceae bacterium]